MSGAKIVEGLKDAVAGNFASVTIEGQRWVRADAPGPLGCDDPVQDTYLVGGEDLKAMSGSVESDRVIQLHFRRTATDADRKWLLDAINAKIALDKVQVGAPANKPSLMEPVGDDDEENELVWRLEHPAWSHSLTGPVQLDKETAVADMRLAASEIKRLQPYEVELRRIAEDLGEPTDPFAAWEVFAGRLRTTARTVEPDVSKRIRELAVRLSIAGWMAGENGIEEVTKAAERELLEFACDEIKRHLDRAALSAAPVSAPDDTVRQALAAVTVDLISSADKDEDPLEWTSVRNAYAALGLAISEPLPRNDGKSQS